MKIPASVVGATAGPSVQTIDARWLMAYAAALGETAGEYFDTTRPDGVCAHPLFPVCYEWPVAEMIRPRTLGTDVAARSVHATHDLQIHRRARAGDKLSTTATIISVEPRPPGAYVVTRFDTVDDSGRPVSTTDYGSIHRGVQCDAAGVSPDGGGPRSRHSEAPAPEWSDSIQVPANLAHVYTECARIWNPIHTDKAVAIAAGLPDIILHGTATLALAVSSVLRRCGLGADVTRIACRFSGMVPLPSTLTVAGWRDAERRLMFHAMTPDGGRAVRDGCLTLAATPPPVETRR